MDFKMVNLEPPTEIGNNKIIAKDVQRNKSTILFRGENNVLYVEDGAILNNVVVKFSGDNSLVYIGKTPYKNCSFQTNIFNDSVFYFVKNNSINGERAIFSVV